MKKLAATFSFAAFLVGQTAITTAQYDNQRTGAILTETILTPRNVGSPRFGRLFTIHVEGEVHAQPLYVPNVEMPGKGRRNAVYIATESDRLYAVDADTGEALWRIAFADATRGVTPLTTHDVRCSFLGPEIGITPTPVIDLAGKTIFVLVRTRERASSGEVRYYQRLHAIDIRTGAERSGSPVLIRAQVTSSSWFGLSTKEVSFHALRENPRAAMLLSRGTVYIAWGSSCDVTPYYGWVIGYDASTLRQTAVFNTAPDAGGGGIWQSGAGIAADDQGNIYASTGNGSFTASRGGVDYGDSVLKLESKSLRVLDFFTPFDEASLNRADNDLGSSGPVLLPAQEGPRPHLLAIAGKSGRIYLLDRDRLGHKDTTGKDGNAVDVAGPLGKGVYGGPAYWNGHLFLFGDGDMLRDYALRSGRLSAEHVGKQKFRNPGAIPSISANGSKDGIVWVVLTKSYFEHAVPAVLQAYDASDVGRLLYTSENAGGGEGPGTAVRFTVPSVANGKVYVNAVNGVAVYGLKR